MCPAKKRNTEIVGKPGNETTARVFSPLILKLSACAQRWTIEVLVAPALVMYMSTDCCECCSQLQPQQNYSCIILKIKLCLPATYTDT